MFTNVNSKILFILILLSGLSSICYSQKPIPKDSLLNKQNTHSANRAALYSTIIPGLGQVYNKKYWKIPIVYGGFGLLAYSYNIANKNYDIFNKEFNSRLLGDSAQLNPLFKDANYKIENILASKHYYQRNRELSIIGFVVWYTLNIIDATVDAHLYSFDVSEDLAMKFKPYIVPNNYALNSFNTGVSLVFTFK